MAAIKTVLTQAATGTADAIVLTFNPAITSYEDKRVFIFIASGNNQTATPIIQFNTLATKIITRIGGQPLRPSDIPGAGARCFIQYDLTNDRFELLNPYIRTLEDARSANNQLSGDIDFDGNSAVNISEVAKGNIKLILQALYTVLTTDNEGYTSPFVYLQPGSEASIGYNLDRAVQVLLSQLNVVHPTVVNIDSPNVNLVQKTAGRILTLDSFKNIESVLMLDTDGNLSANSDTRIPSQKAIKTYADALLAANDAMVFKGAIDCSTNPNYPAADTGHTYRISVAGKIGGASGINVEVNDTITCLADGTISGDQATVGSYWSIVQANLDGAVTGPTSSTDSNIPLFDGVSGKLLKDSGKNINSFMPAGTRSFGITIDGQGGVISTGIKGDYICPYKGTIVGWEILSDQSGSMIIDVWKDTYANFPPTVADTIAGTEKPTLASASKNQDLSLTSWTTSVNEGDIVRFNVDSCTSITRATLVIFITPTF